MWSGVDVPNIRASAYLSTLLVGSVLALWAGYLWPGQPIFKGQSPALLVGIVSIVLASVIWLLLGSRTQTRGTLTWFLAMLGVTWITFLALYRFHGDAFTYSAFGLPLVLFLLWRKPPSVREGISSLQSFAWAVVFVIIATLLLEWLGIIPAKYQHWQIIRFDETFYWLPLNDLLGIEGRWPGPFGHNGYTAMMGAFLILIAAGFWTRSSWSFLTVGIFTLFVTAGRASIGAALAGLVIIGMLSPSKRLSRVPKTLRISVGVAVLLAGLFALLSGRAGLTGRQNIWPAFFDLWETSPWVGVGSEAIASSGGTIGQYGHAHSLYLDILARYGLVTLTVVIVSLGIGMWIALRASLRGLPGPLALITAYLIIGVTEPRNDWLHPGMLVLMVITSVMIAGAAILRPKSDLSSTSSGLREEGRIHDS